MKKKAQVVLLPTDKVSRLYTDNRNRLQFSFNIERTKPDISHHLYFVSDDEIKEDDWFMTFGEINNMPSSEYSLIHKCFKAEEYVHFDGKRVRLFVNNEIGHYSGYNPKEDIHFKKIVATTNSELHYKNRFKDKFDDGDNVVKNVAKIGDDFLQAYVKAYNEGKSITQVMLEYEQIDKPKGHSNAYNEEFIKLRSNGTVIISPVVENLYTRTDVENICNACVKRFGNMHTTENSAKDWLDKEFPE